ncbi:helix-turn-helix transcriptional regulator [Micromonosporaceae bacterium B7E4]
MWRRCPARRHRLAPSLRSHQAAAELGRCGQRQTGGLELTPTERNVTMLVVTGLTNHEVAARMFISPKTVEANLTRIYRKLGVHNRQGAGASGHPGSGLTSITGPALTCGAVLDQT